MTDGSVISVPLIVKDRPLLSTSVVKGFEWWRNGSPRLGFLTLPRASCLTSRLETNARPTAAFNGSSASSRRPPGCY